MLSGKRVVLGVTGGIAAYKAAFLLRELQQEGAEIRVTMTPAATRFVGVETFASLSRHEVAVDIFPDQADSEGWTRHIGWGEWADLFVIAPCTANTLAKIVHGLADNMLTSTVLASRCPMLVCPTMDGEMYNHPATRRNMSLAEEYGYHILEPEEGYLASGLEGKGRLPEITSIVKACIAILDGESGKKKVDAPLTGKNVLVTAGPTREHIDPVRFISNPSSGKMGFAMAEAARDLGGDVTLVHGPVHLSSPPGIRTVEIESASQLFEKVKDFADADIVIMAAAVSDFAPENTFGHKIKKDTAEGALRLKPTQDILKWLGAHRKNSQVIIGFAMETEELMANARKKLKEKKADWIIANSLSEPESGFSVDTNRVILIGKDVQKEFEGLKKKIAINLLQHILSV